MFDGKKNTICGVGAVAGMTNPGLARSAAEGRARVEIARSLRDRVKAMLSDYQAQTGAGPKKGAEEQHLEDTSRQITDITLSGTRLQDTWVSNPGTFYALVVLDKDAFIESLKGMAQIDEQVRAAIVARADKSFAELDAKTEGPPPLPPLDATAGGNN
jgi:hypothetical protein